MYPLLVVGTAERHIQIFNLTNPTTPFKVSQSFFISLGLLLTGSELKTIQSPLKWQTRTVACFPTGNGFAVGSVEGRVAIQYVSTPFQLRLAILTPILQICRRKGLSVSSSIVIEHQYLITVLPCRNNFSFKCHRRDQTPNAKDQSLVYAVNDISFHPVHGTFSTCGWYLCPTFLIIGIHFSLIGSDGTINYWDKDARTRLKSTFFSGSSLFFVMSDWIILQQLLSLAPGLFPQRASTVTAPSSRTPYRTTGPRDTPACHQVIPTN